MEARERSAGRPPTAPPHRPQGRGPQTALSLMTGASTQMNCAYCNHSHPSESCQTVTSSEARRQVLLTAGRCFWCLRRGHMKGSCRQNVQCSRCHGRHHRSICSTSTPGTRQGSPLTKNSDEDSHSSTTGTTQASVMYVSSHTPILLQTAKAMVCDQSPPP